MSEYRFLCPKCGKGFEEGTLLTVCPDCQVLLRSTSGPADAPSPAALPHLPQYVDVAGLMQSVLAEQPQEETFESVLRGVLKRRYPDESEEEAVFQMFMQMLAKRKSGLSRLEAARRMAEGRVDWSSLPVFKMGTGPSSGALAQLPSHIDLTKLMRSVVAEQPREETLDAALRAALKRHYPESEEILFPLLTQILSLSAERELGLSRVEAARQMARGRSEMDVSPAPAISWSWRWPGKVSVKTVVKKTVITGPERVDRSPGRRWGTLATLLVFVVTLLVLFYLIHRGK